MRRKHEEEQRFSDRAVFCLLALGLFGSLFIGVKRLVTSPPTWDAAPSIGVAAAIAAATVVLSRQRIEVRINRRGISYKAGPFHRRKQKLRWADVDSCDILRAPPAGDWLGSNVHLSDLTVASLVGRNGPAIAMGDGRHDLVGVKNLDQLRDLFDAPPHVGFDVLRETWRIHGLDERTRPGRCVRGAAPEQPETPESGARFTGRGRALRRHGVRGDKEGERGESPDAASSAGYPALDRAGARGDPR